MKTFEVELREQADRAAARHNEILTTIEEIRIKRMSPSQRAAYAAERSETLQQRNGNILESLTKEDAQRLAHRYEPLPEPMRSEAGIERAIKEFSQLLAWQIDEKFGIVSSPQ
jgi:hypothetical protein